MRARTDTLAKTFRLNNSTACSREFLPHVSSANAASPSIVSNQRWPALLDQRFSIASKSLRNRSGERHDAPQALTVSISRESDVATVTSNCDAYLHVVRIGLLGNMLATAVKNDNNVHARPILIMPQFLD